MLIIKKVIGNSPDDLEVLIRFVPTL